MVSIQPTRLQKIASILICINLPSARIHLRDHVFISVSRRRALLHCRWVDFTRADTGVIVLFPFPKANGVTNECVYNTHTSL